MRFPLQAVVSLGQIYGDVLYFATCMFDPTIILIVGSTSNVTPVFRVSNAVGVVGVTGKLFDIGRRHGSRHNTTHISSEGLRNLRRLELGRVAELADDFDYRALPALGCHTGSGEEVHPLFLVQRSNDHLKLGICKYTGERGKRG